MKQITGLVGCLAAFIGVALGAFGAHALKSRLAEAGMTDVWQTAVDYQMWHALALLLCAAVTRSGVMRSVATSFFAIGIVLFCGSLYWLALDGPRWLGPITPLGGLSFMLGWLCLGVGFIRAKAPESAC
jgi:uncharacterized membrane protein YgdD (TMEM256/DUF423 family)